jgi:hypothetical protein
LSFLQVVAVHQALSIAGRAIARRAKLRCCARTGAECNEPSTGNG